MPTYEYQCSDCGHLFEQVQKMSEPTLKTCPACGKDSLRRLVSAPAFHLKGSGWYKTDYASSNGKGSTGAGGSSTDSGTSGAVSSGSDSSGSGKDTVANSSNAAAGTGTSDSTVKTTTKESSPTSS